jgi:hypothetical protein
MSAQPDQTLRLGTINTLEVYTTLTKNQCLTIADDQRHPRPEYLAVVGSSNKKYVVHKLYVKLIPPDSFLDEQEELPLSQIPQNQMQALRQKACSYMKTHIPPSVTAELLANTLKEYSDYASIYLAKSEVLALSDNIVRSQINCIR